MGGSWLPSPGGGEDDASCAQATAPLTATRVSAAMRPLIIRWILFMDGLLLGEEEERDQQGVQRLRFDEGEAGVHHAVDQRRGFGLARGRLDALAKDDADAHART